MTQIKTDRKKAIIDLLIILGTTIMVVIGFLLVSNSMGSSGGSSVSGADGTGVSGTTLLLQTMVGSLTEFAMLGLGICIVCALRKERFSSFGLTKKRLIPTLLLTALVCMPSLLHKIVTMDAVRYVPFQGVSFTKELLVAEFPIKIIGFLLVFLAWGFFEGFTYVVLSNRVNKLFPCSHWLCNWGAIFSAIFCILLHTALGLPPESFLSGLCDFLIIYGMLIVKEETGNAWGCVAVYVFFWNALL